MAEFAGPAPTQKIADVDQVLPSQLVTTAHNVCIVTPAIKGDRVLMFLTWQKPPSEQEAAEVWELLQSKVGMKPDFIASAKSVAEANEIAQKYAKGELDQ